MRFSGWGICCVAALVAAAAGASPAGAAEGFITATGCEEHQAFVEGDDSAVGEKLPGRYVPVRAPSGQPLLFVRAIRCDALGVGARSAPGVMASFGVVIESPDGLGCASSAPVLGGVNGENPPICNWYTLSWLSDARRVVGWLRDDTPGFPAVHVPGLEFELGEFDGAQGGAPFRFRTPASAPSPFTIDAVGREHPGELAVRGGYWADTPQGTVKIALSTDLTSGDATGVVTAAPGSPLATLMGAGQRSYVPGYSSFAAERWQHASYRKQKLASAAGSNRFEGSCAFEGTVRFDPPATNAKSQELTYDWTGTGTCTGALNGEDISEAPVTAAQRGRAEATCGEARTIAPGSGAITFPGGRQIPYTIDFRSVQTEVDIMFYGDRSGFARGHASFLTDRTSPDVVARCGGDGVAETPLDLTLTTESPLVSEPRRALRLAVAPARVRRGHRRAFRFRVTTSDGRPVAHAVVRFAGRRVRAGRAGRATLLLRLKRARRYRAVATLRGFHAARATVVAR
jgi:hypothetical protein